MENEIKDNRRLFKNRPEPDPHPADENVFVEYGKIDKDETPPGFTSMIPGQEGTGSYHDFFMVSFERIVTNVTNELKRQSRINPKKRRSISTQRVANGTGVPLNLGIEVYADHHRDAWGFLEHQLKPPIALPRLKDTLVEELPRLIRAFDQDRLQRIAANAHMPLVSVRGIYHTHQVPHMVFVLLVGWDTRFIIHKDQESMMTFYSEDDAMEYKKWKASLN